MTEVNVTPIETVTVPQPSKPKRAQERMTLDQKREVLQRIFDVLGKTVVTRKELKDNIDKIAINPVGNPWAQVRFLVNDAGSAAVAGKRGIYDITKSRKFGFKPLVKE